MRELFITRAAEADVLEIWCYVFERNPPAADRVIDDITAQYKLLLDHPLIGQAREDIEGDYRSLAIGSYLVFTASSLTRSRYRGLSMAHETSPTYSPRLELDWGLTTIWALSRPPTACLPNYS